MRHARPHLQTHGRSQGHSAVAGAAYRLGLRLYDERTKIWHDFRRRKLGEEILRALTVAPEGAPDWATDPSQLRNRAETSEKRKDAQMALGCRVPIPFVLTSQQAGDMAEIMARFIADDELSTKVSLGLVMASSMRWVFLSHRLKKWPYDCGIRLDREPPPQ